MPICPRTAPCARRSTASIAAFDHVDSATDPDPHRPPLRRARTTARSSASAPPALAFGRVASVLQSIESLLAVMGPRPAAFVRALRSGARRRALEPLVHRWIRGRDLVALLLDPAADAARVAARSRASSLAGRRSGDAATSAPALESLLDARARRPTCAPPTAARAEAAGRLLFLSAAVGRQRVQAAEPVPALDGAQDAIDLGVWTQRVAGAADRAARHARDPAGPVPAADALHEPGLEDGRRDHRVAARARSRGSGALRLLAVPRRHDERVRLQPARRRTRSARCAASAGRSLASAPRRATVRSTVKPLVRSAVASFEWWHRLEAKWQNGMAA